MLESVIGFFLLAMVMLGVLRMVDYALFYSSQAQQKAVAVRVAQRTLNDIRIWAAVPASPGLNYDDWSSWNGHDQSDPIDSGYRVRVTVADQVLQSPCSELELARPVADRRVMSSSCKLVEILVSWAYDRKEYRLVSLVAEPARPLPATIAVSGGGSSVAPDGTAAFTATAYDAGGVEIKDVFFDFSMKPGPGNGTLAPARTGANVTFTNRIDQPNQPPIYTVGPAVVEATTVYHGETMKGESGAFTLTP